MAKRLIINDRNEDHDIAFFVLTEEDKNKLDEDLEFIGKSKIKGFGADAIKEVESKLGFKVTKIMAYGSTDITLDFAEKIIPFVTIGGWHAKRYNDKKYLSYSYFCPNFSGWDYNVKDGFRTGPIHTDAIQSWNCIMSNCRNPKFGLILKLNKGENINKIPIYGKC